MSAQTNTSNVQDSKSRLSTLVHELNYHPLTYKEYPCNDLNYQKNSICSRGVKCWQYHDNLDDRRNVRNVRNVFIPSTLQEAGLSKGSPPPEQYMNYLHHIKSQPLPQSPP
eukprot:60131_1